VSIGIPLIILDTTGSFGEGGLGGFISGGDISHVSISLFIDVFDDSDRLANLPHTDSGMPVINLLFV
jgi:hypothetical protein